MIEQNGKVNMHMLGRNNGDGIFFVRFIDGVSYLSLSAVYLVYFNVL